MSSVHLELRAAIYYGFLRTTVWPGRFTDHRVELADTRNGATLAEEVLEELTDKDDSNPVFGVRILVVFFFIK